MEALVLINFTNLVNAPEYGGTARGAKSQAQINPLVGKSLQSYLKTVLSWPVFSI